MMSTPDYLEFMSEKIAVACVIPWLQEFWRCFHSIFGEDTDTVEDNNPEGIYTNEILWF